MDGVNDTAVLLRTVCKGENAQVAHMTTTAGIR